MSLPSNLTAGQMTGKRRLYRFLWQFAFLLLIMVLVAVGGVYLVIKSERDFEWLRVRLESTINDKMEDGLSVSIGSARFAEDASANTRLVLGDLKFQAAESGVSVFLERVSVKPAWSELLAGKIAISDVALNTGQVILEQRPKRKTVEIWQNVPEQTLSALTKRQNLEFADPYLSGSPPRLDESDAFTIADNEVQNEPEVLLLLSKVLSQIGKGLDQADKFDVAQITVDDLILITLDENKERVERIHISSASLAAMSVDERIASAHVLTINTLQRGQPGVTLEVNFSKEKESGNRAFGFAVSNVIARNFIEKMNDPAYAVKVEVPFGAVGTLVVSPEPFLKSARFKLIANEGSVTTGPKSTFDVDSGAVNLVLNSRDRSLTIEPSPFHFGKNRLVPEGRIRLPEKLTDPYDFELYSDDNYFDSPDVNKQPVSIERISAKGAMQPLHKLISVTNFETNSNLVQANGAASFGFDGRTPSMAAAVELGAMPSDVLKQVWPIFIAPSARKWVIGNFHSGRFLGGSFDASIPTGVLGNLRKGATMSPDQMRFDFSIDEASFSSFGEFPDVNDAAVTGRVRGISFDLEVKDAEAFADDDDKVTIPTARFGIQDFRFPGPIANVALEVVGQADDIGSIANRAPVRALSRADLVPESLGGNVVANVEVSVPLRNELAPGEVQWKADLAVKGFSSAEPIDGRKIEKAKATVKLNPEEMVIVGTGVIDGLEVNIDLNQPLGEAGQAPTITVDTILSDEDRQKLGIDLDDYLKGPVATFIDKQSEGEGRGEKYRFDLSKAEIRLDFLGWRKAEGVTAEATMTIETTNKGTTIRNIVLKGDGFGAEGALELNKSGEIKSLKLTRFALGPNDNLQVSANLRSEKIYEISVTGTTFDARSLIKKITNTPGEEGDASPYRYKIDASIGEVRGYQKTTVLDLLANVTLRGNTPLKLTASGSTDTQDRPFSISYGAAQNKGDVLIADGLDGGALLRFSNIYYRAYGGPFVVKGVRPIGQKAMKGSFQMKRFTLVEEPALKGLTASQDSQGRSAVKFKIFEAKFSEENRVLNFRKGLLSGGEVGGTFEGTLDRRTKTVDLVGDYIPIYALNNVIVNIPIFGQVLGNKKDGLIGVTFKIAGTIGSPKVSVNPLSALAPGRLRNLFNFRKEQQKRNSAIEEEIDEAAATR